MKHLLLVLFSNLLSYCRFGVLSSIKDLFRAISGPKYDGKYLHSKVKQLLGNLKIRDTLTDILIPTFDIKLFQPTIFTTYEVIIFGLLLIYPSL